MLIWHGSLWHGGGANTSGERRIGIAMNYCAGYIRQQENQQLGIPREVVAGFEPRLRELVGYGIYTGLIGHIDKRPPSDLLGDVRRTCHGVGCVVTSVEPPEPSPGSGPIGPTGSSGPGTTPLR